MGWLVVKICYFITCCFDIGSINIYLYGLCVCVIDIDIYVHLATVVSPTHLHLPECKGFFFAKDLMNQQLDLICFNFMGG